VGQARRRYHKIHQREQNRRRYEIRLLMDEWGWPVYGVGGKLARQFGVSEATISRDIAHLRERREMLRELGLA